MDFRRVTQNSVRCGIVLAVFLMTAPAAAISINAIANQTVYASQDWTLAVRATGVSGLFVTWTASRANFPEGTSLSCNPLNISTYGSSTMPGMRTLTRRASTTLSWPAEHNTYLLGDSCVVLRACDNSGCDDELFAVTVTHENDKSANSAPRIYRHDYRVYRAGEPNPMYEPLRMWSTRVTPQTPVSDLLELVGCPSGWSCSPPTLPSWVTLESSATEGLRFGFEPPHGPPGDWDFRAKLPYLQNEHEDNSWFSHPNFVSDRGAIRASISPIDDYDMFTFYAHSGDSIDVWTSTSRTSRTTCSIGVDTHMSLYAASSLTLIDSDDNSGGYSCSRITYTVEEEGWFRLVVREDGDNATIANYYVHLVSPLERAVADFTVRLIDPALVDPDDALLLPFDKLFPEHEGANDALDTAPSLIGNGVASGSIYPVGDIDNYAFFAPASTLDTFVLTDQDGGCSWDSTLTLYRKLADDTLEELASSDDHGSTTCPRIDDYPVDPGNHYIVRVQEDGDDDVVYNYALKHRTFLNDAEPLNDDPATAPLLFEQYTLTGDPDTRGINLGMPGTFTRTIPAGGVRAALSGADALDYFVIKVFDGERLLLRTEDGFGGCPGDTYLWLYRWDPPGSVDINTPPDADNFDLSDLVQVASDDNGGVGDCSAIDYSSTPKAYYVIKLTKQTADPLDPIILLYEIQESDALTPTTTPSWRDQDSFAPPFAHGLWSVSMTYGGDGFGASPYEAFGFGLRDYAFAADHFAAYLTSVVTSSDCDPVNTYGTTDPHGYDGDGACRSFAGGIHPVPLSPEGWTETDTMVGTMVGFIPSRYEVGSTQRGHFVAFGADVATANRGVGEVEIGGSDEHSAIEITTSYGGNSYSFGIVEQDAGGLTNVLPNVFYEGEKFSFDLTRRNRLASVTLSRCISSSDTTCSQPLLGATYSQANDQFNWTIPYTAVTSGSTEPKEFNFRLIATGSAGRGESDSTYRLNLLVADRNRGSKISADLLLYQIRERYPLAYTQADNRLYVANRSFTSALWSDSRYYYSGLLGHNEPFGRSLAVGDKIHIHPLFEMGDLGDPLGPAVMQVNIINRGGQSSAKTKLRAYVQPVYADAFGELTSDPPTAGDTPIDIYNIGVTASGGEQTLNIPLPYLQVMPYAGANPWDGFPSALFLVFEGESNNDVNGPYYISPTREWETGFSVYHSGSGQPDVSGIISSVSPSSPQSGDEVTVTVLCMYNSHWNSTGATPYLRFYEDQEDPPTSSTSYSDEEAHETSPTAAVPYVHTFTFTAQKPDDAANELHLRALLDATNARDEGAAGEANNQLPSVGAAQELEVSNSDPAFDGSSTTFALTEDTLWSNAFQFTDDDDVDLDRMTCTTSDGPSGLATNGAVYSCGGDYRCQEVRWTPDDDAAVTGSHTVTVTICDGDPVAGGDGACVDALVTLNVARVNDAPVITSGDGPLTATEDTTYTFTFAATDEEGTSLTYSLQSNPTGMTIDSSSGQISWTPSDIHVGATNRTRPRATDTAPAGTTTAAWAQTTWDIAVSNVNDDPYLDEFDPTSGDEGDEFTSLARVYDDDIDIADLPQVIDCDLDTGAPDWLSVSAEYLTGEYWCELSGTPDNPDTGVQSVTVLVTDSAGGSDSRTFDVTIADVNQAPTFTTSPSTQSATQGTEWSIVLEVSDPDMLSPAAAETLTYTQESGPTATLTPASDSLSVTVTWTPGAADANSTPSMTFQVEDRRGSTDTVAFSFSTIGNINDPPYWDPAPEDLELDEGDQLSGSISAGDPDADVGLSETLSYSIVAGAPPDTEVEGTTGVLSFSTADGRADDDQVGVWTVTVRVEDDEAPTPAGVDTTFTLTVNNVNDAPTITSTAPTDTDEDAAFSYTLEFDDADTGDSHTLAATTLPDWLEFDDSTGVLSNKSGRPDNDDVGDHSVELEVSDTLASDTQAFTISVNNTNDTPAITSTEVTVATQDVSYSYTLTAVDDDTVHGDSITLSAETLPSWLGFNPVTGLLSGTPSNTNVGLHSVVLRATDADLAYDQQSFSIDVANVNDPPVLAAIGSQSVAEDELLTFTVSASDPDGTTPAVTVTPATLPAGASFDGTTFSWQTQFGDEGNYDVEFVASDTLLTDSEVVRISVGDVPRPPTLGPIGDRTLAEAATLSFTVSASDPDVGDTLTLSAVGTTGMDPFLEGATFVAATGLFSFTPGYEDSGLYQVTFTVTDSTDLTDSETITIDVTDSNRAPYFTTTPPTSSNEDESFSYVAAATDPDGDTLQWNLLDGPAGMTIDGGDGTLLWLPTNADVGDHDVAVGVDDGRVSATVRHEFVLEVVNVNDTPVISSTAPTVAIEDVGYSYTLVAADVDPGDSLTLSAETLPAWLSFDDQSGLLTGTPSNAHVGDHQVVLRATDLDTAFDQEDFTITVQNVNNPPVLVAPTPTGTVTGSEDALLTFTIAATDADGPSLSYGGSGLPSGATIDSTSGVFTWTPGFTEAGTRDITVYADDTIVRTSRVLTLDIANTDRAPEITAPAEVSGPEAVLLTFVVSATDPDGDSIALAMVSGPTGATFDDGEGRFSWTPDYDQSGDHVAEFEATANGVTVETQTDISVSHVNRAPLITSTAPTTATEDQALSYQVTADDADGDTLRFLVTTAPLGTTLHESSGQLGWTPSGAQTGMQSFDILVTDDNGGLTHHLFVIDVAAVNDPPFFTSTAVEEATEDEVYLYEATAVDEEDPTLSYSLDTAPQGMAVDALTGLVDWLPTNDDVGDHTVVLVVQDSGGGQDTQSFTVSVDNVNDPPVIEESPAPPATVVEGALWTWSPTVTEVDQGDVATLQLIEAPAAMTLLGGVLSWTPGNADVGDHTVRLRAEDLSGANDVYFHTVTVVNLNDPPFFTSVAINTSVAEQDAFAFVVEAGDIDMGDVLTFSLIGAPAQMAIDPDTGLLTFTPDDAEVGTHNFTLRVDDSAGGFAEQGARAVVTPVNDPPVLQAVGNQQVAIDDTLVISLVATDPDGPSTLFSTQNAPPAATLVGNVFTWATSEADSGPHQVTFVVSDGSLSDSETITIVVGDGGLPPDLYLPEDAVVDEGEPLAAMITASDPQTGEAVAPVLLNPAQGVSFDAQSGAFLWTPGYDVAGLYAFEFAASNGSGTSTRTWNVQVRNVNRSPYVTTLVLPAAMEGTPYTVTIEATDPDGDSLTFSLVEGPAGAAIDEATGVLTINPSYQSVGQHTVVVRVRDGQDGLADQEYLLRIDFIDADGDNLPDTWEAAVGTDTTRDDSAEDPDGDNLSNLDEHLGGTDPFVSNAPSAPILVSPVDGRRVDSNQPTLIWAASTDPDGDAISYTVRVAPDASPVDVAFVAEEIVLVSDQGEIDVGVALDEGVLYRWWVVATDGVGSTTSTSRTFVVDAVNQPPPAPTPLSPTDNAVVPFAAPTLTASQVLDPDGDAVTYVFTLRETRAGDPIVTSSAVTPPDLGPVSYNIPQLLLDGTTWYWEVQASDVRGLSSEVSAQFRFEIDLQNLPPPTPALISPLDGALVNTDDATLRLGAVIDPEGAQVTYVAHFSPDGTFDPGSTVELVVVSANAEGEVVFDLSSLEDGTWFWRAWASDGEVDSLPVEASFVLDLVDLPPPAPTLLSPADNSSVGLPVTLSATVVADPEGDEVSHRIEVTDVGGNAVIDHMANIVDRDDGVVDGVISAVFPSLTPGERYGWRAQAVESDGVTSPYSHLRTFRVEGGNQRPTAPVLIYPVDETVTSPRPTLSFAEAVDPDGDSVTHEIEVLDSQDGLVAQQSALLATAGVVTHTLGVGLANGVYTWRARGRDDLGQGLWSTATFTVAAVQADGGVLGDARGADISGVDGGLADVVGQDTFGVDVSRSDVAAQDGSGSDSANRDHKEIDQEYPSHYDPDDGVVTDMGYEPDPPPLCDCSGTGGSGGVLGVVLIGFAFGRRWRRREM